MMISHKVCSLSICTLSLAATRSWVIGRTGFSVASSFPSGTEGAEQSQGAGRPSEAGRGSLTQTYLNQQRRSYKLLDSEVVHVTYEILIQESELEFDRDGMHDRIHLP